MAPWVAFTLEAAEDPAFFQPMRLAQRKTPSRYFNAATISPVCRRMLNRARSTAASAS
jgi:hypothetical protein